MPTGTNLWQQSVVNAGWLDKDSSAIQPAEPTDLQLLTRDEARRSFAAVPHRPGRKLEACDRLITAGIVVLSFVAGLLALSGLAS